MRYIIYLVSVHLLIFVSCGGGTKTATPTITGSGCEEGIGGYYFVDLNECAAGTLYNNSFWVSQSGSDITVYATVWGNLTGTIDNNCHFSLSVYVDESRLTYKCEGKWTDGVLECECDNVSTQTGNIVGTCTYRATRLTGRGCEGDLSGYYTVTATDYENVLVPRCEFYNDTYSVAQDGNNLTFVAELYESTMIGYLNDLCVLEIPSGCLGIYLDDEFRIACADCYVTATPVPLVARFSLGAYNKANLTECGFDFGDIECTPYPLGDSVRLFITNVYADDGKILSLSESSKIEAEDFGGNILFSVAISDDYTFQYSAGGDTCDGQLTVIWPDTFLDFGSNCQSNCKMCHSQ